ncbi:MAG TPA: hypothetical protein VHT68_22100 [Pseudolabrys sp.]|jgi:hypothetical protein|nr:hypothetical protein [Pseudolabrys sp.]
MLLIPTKLEQYRHKVWPIEMKGWFSFLASKPGDNFGAFYAVPGPCGEALRMIVSDGNLDSDDELDAWEHVSVSLARAGRARLPNWEEMCFVKNLFWEDEDCVVQYHPPLSKNVNNYRVLHLWRSLRQEFPQPPMEAVGIQSLGELK